MEQTAVDESLEKDSGRKYCQVCGATCLIYTACTDCQFACFFCDKCLPENHEVLKGHSLLGHTLVPNIVPCTSKYKRNRCGRHGEKLRYYCENCRKQICSDCLLDPNCKWHSVMKMNEFILKKKEILIKCMENTSGTMSKIDYYPEMLFRRRNEIQLAWMFKKDHLRQEFASLYDLIAEREQELFLSLNEKVTDALSNLSAMRHQYQDLAIEETTLVDKSLNALRKITATEFITENEQVLSGMDSFTSAVSGLPGVDCDIPSFLTMPISFHQEKLKLDAKLDSASFDYPRAMPRQSIVYIQKHLLYFSYRIRDFICMPASLPPSTTLEYKVNITTEDQTDLWNSSSYGCSIDTVIFNAPARVLLISGKSYLLRIQTLYTVVINGATSKTTIGQACFILVVAAGAASIDTTVKSTIAPGFSMERDMEMQGENKVDNTSMLKGMDETDVISNNDTNNAVQRAKTTVSQSFEELRYIWMKKAGRAS